MKNPFLIALVSGLLAAGAIKAAPAFAQAPAAAPEIQVSLVKTSDLDLSSEKGRRVLDLRLARAAREVCGIPSDADVAGQSAARKCRDEALGEATGQRDALMAAAARGATIEVTASR